MDFPKSVPNVGLVNGKFVDENTGNGQPGSLIPAVWGNSVTEEILNVLHDAGVIPDELKLNQLSAAISAIASKVVVRDAMPVGAGGLMTVAPTVVGKVADLPGSQFIFTSDNTTDTPPGFVYSVGLHIKGPDNSSVDLFSSLVSEEYVIRRNYPTNPTPARRLWHDGNFNPGDKANKATTLGGYGISDAYTKNQTDSAISTATSNKADKATTLGGYGITNAYTTGQVDSAISNAVSGKADRANTLAGYGITNAYTIGQVDSALALKFDKSGGTINGATTVSTAAQSNSVPGFTVYTPGGAGASANLMLSTSISGAYLSHATGSNTVYIRNHASGYADVDAGDIYSFGARCHTTTSFLKPVTGQWVQLAGSNPVIPAGGTWAYQVTNYTSGGAATGAIAGIVAGGTAVGGANSNGFAWKISQCHRRPTRF